MSERDEQIIRAEAALQQAEKKFLMEKYASMLLLQVNEDESESDDADDLDDETVESLLVARPYVSGEVAQQIADLLTAKGHEFEEDEEEGGGSNGRDAFEADDSGDFADDGNGEVEGLFDEDGEAGADDPEAMAASLELDEDAGDDNGESEQREETSEVAEEEDAEGLFEDAESDFTDAVVAADDDEEEDDGGEVEGLFDEEDDASD